VTEIGGKHREPLLDVHTLLIPAEQGPDCEAMPEVVHARSGAITKAPQTDLAGQAPEDTVDVLMQQSTTALGDEEVCAAARSEMCAAPVGVAAERRAGCRMQRHEARLAELGQPDRQQAGLQVDVVTLEADRLGQTHARHRDQPEQIMIGPSAQPVFWRQSQRRCQQRIDLRVTVDIGLGTLQSRQDAGGWHLRLRLDVRDMAREAPHVSQSQRPGRMPIGQQRRPLHRQLRGDGRGLALLHEGDEIGEPSCLMVVLVSKPLAHAQIPVERGTQTGHCTPPGHGRLSVRSASTSTFA
jgi:hypothetical protein